MKTREDKATAAALADLRGTVGWELIKGTLRGRFNRQCETDESLLVKASKMAQEVLRGCMKNGSSAFMKGMERNEFIFESADFSSIVEVAIEESKN